MKPLPDENPVWPRYMQQGSCEKMAYYLFFFRQFWVKEPRHSGTIFAKKRYTSIVARVRGGRGGEG